MRIIAGTAKNRKLNLPKGVKIRSTLNKVKEALFSILGEYVQGREVLDLFAGSGALGIEALSRGAKSATFVDNNPHLIRAIGENLKNLDFTGRSVVLDLDAPRAVEYLEAENKKFDLILTDPPYGMANIVLKSLTESDILKNCFVIVVEHYKKDILAARETGLKRVKLARYGDTMLSFYKDKSECKK
ncbi:MAG: 16S rRNA (guanine(966)-N(2))-methyltransferase RsmD [Candidatus Omnitrophota bacterium]|nr:16S rRNA (guanine(966)-N(2))-methyltransferase RsmD [Candidatus Omnitrophota bacterium]